MTLCVSVQIVVLLFMMRSCFECVMVGMRLCSCVSAVILSTLLDALLSMLLILSVGPVLDGQRLCVVRTWSWGVLCVNLRM